MADKLFRLKDIARRYSVSRITIYNWVKEEKLPPPDKQVGRIPYWKDKTIEQFEKKSKN